ncbi:MAG: 50S ribosomal protein L25/general stress protein Ctc [Agathobaculum sp.]|jgi:large subunit ribosomal protein L25|uniref:50S ribosomal protein L25/general stress protein Ctc n=1 Tax=Agathobaculum sp. TaxID=2048138 RepID=UPI003D940F1D
MDIIKVEQRDLQTRAKRLRQAGLVPCCVYGGGLPESLHIQMTQAAAEQLLREKREGSRVQLELDGKLIPVQIKEKTRNFADSKIAHIQFQALQMNQKVNSVAHILLKNEDIVPGVLEQMLFEVPFSSLPGDMIDTVTIDLQGMPAGTVLTVSDIPEFRDGHVDLQIEADSMVLRINDKKRMDEQQAGES